MGKIKLSETTLQLFSPCRTFIFATAHTHEPIPALPSWWAWNTRAETPPMCCEHRQCREDCSVSEADKTPGPGRELGTSTDYASNATGQEMKKRKDQDSQEEQPSQTGWPQKLTEPDKEASREGSEGH